MYGDHVWSFWTGYWAPLHQWWETSYYCFWWWLHLLVEVSFFLKVVIIFLNVLMHWISILIVSTELRFCTSYPGAYSCMHFFLVHIFPIAFPLSAQLNKCFPIFISTEDLLPSDYTLSWHPVYPINALRSHNTMIWSCYVLHNGKLHPTLSLVSFLDAVLRTEFMKLSHM